MPCTLLYVPAVRSLSAAPILLSVNIGVNTVVFILEPPTTELIEVIVSLV